MARYWVGGATGFLGSHVVACLAADGHEVVAVARGAGSVVGISVLPVDVSDAARVAETARGADGAFLVTGKVSRDPADAEELYAANVRATRAALEGLRAAGVRRVVVASTSGTLAIGTSASQVFDETSPPPLEHLARWPYYRSKYYGELVALEANAPPDFEVVVVNPSLLLGPGDLRGSSTEDVRKLLDGEVLATPRGGIAFVDVRDAARAMVTAMDRGRAGERYLLSAVNTPVSAFFERIARLSGVPAPLFRLPRSSAVAVEATRLFSRVVKAIGGELPVDDVSVEMAQYYWYCDASRAVAELGFAPRDPGETLKDTIQDLIARGVAHPRTAAWDERDSDAIPA